MKNYLPKTRVSIIRRIAAIFLLLLAQGCTDARYYLQSVTGQLDVLQRRQAIDSLLADKNLDEELRQRLELVQRIRKFAIETLKLPDTGSYKNYANLERSYVVKNLVAAPEFSTQLHSWCYLVIGCATYRGYFDLGMLAELDHKMVGQGFDTHVGAVPAYSTLGWFDDPVLNTVLHWPAYQLAGLIFHELAHQRLYIEDDSDFNESFASAVEQAGVMRWQREENDRLPVVTDAAYVAYKNRIEHRKTVIELIQTSRDELDILYRKDISASRMRAEKKTILKELQDRYQTLRLTWSSDPGFDAWMDADINNAKLGSVLTYHQHVDAFLNLFKLSKNDFERFYQRIEVLSALPEKQREERLMFFRN